MTKRGPCLPAPFSGRGMTGAEFIRALRKLGRRRRVEVRFVTRRGKGSHGTLYWGDRKTIVKDRKKELSRGLLANSVLIRATWTDEEQDGPQHRNAPGLAGGTDPG